MQTSLAQIETTSFLIACLKKPIIIQYEITSVYKKVNFVKTKLKRYSLSSSLKINYKLEIAPKKQNPKHLTALDFDINVEELF